MVHVLWWLLLVDGLTASGQKLHNYVRTFSPLKREDVNLIRINKEETSLQLFKYQLIIDLQGKVWTAILQPHLNLFHKDFKGYHYNNSDGPTFHFKPNFTEHLEGYLVEEVDSKVLVHAKDGLLSGSFLFSNKSTFFVEPSARFIKEDHDYHMILYDIADLQFNRTNPQFCTHDLPNPSESGSIPSKYSTEEYLMYSRRKRDLADKKTCDIALIADYSFFSSVSGKDELNAMNYMISLMQQVNAILTAQSLDPSGSKSYEGFGIQVKYVEVISTPLIDEAYSGTYKYYSEDSPPSAVDLLGNFAYGKWSGYCLAHLFTGYDFDNGMLGLAYIASASTLGVGGICSRTYIDASGRTKSPNVGLSSAVNYGRTLLTSEHMFVTG